MADLAVAAVLPVVVMSLTLLEVAEQALQVKEIVALGQAELVEAAAVEAVVQVLSLRVAQARLTQ
jgi:acetaldehyde dehydrogenase (acetylating)